MHVTNSSSYIKVTFILLKKSIMIEPRLFGIKIEIPGLQGRTGSILKRFLVTPTNLPSLRNCTSKYTMAHDVSAD